MDGSERTPSVESPLQPDAHPIQAGRKLLLKRLLLLVGGACTFALVASVIQPGASRASGPNSPTLDSEDSIRDVSSRLLHQRHSAGWPCLGLLRGAKQFVLIHGSPDGPRYSVYTFEGRLMLADLPADDVYRELPDLDIGGMRLEPGAESEPLMLFTPKD